MIQWDDSLATRMAEENRRRRQRLEARRYREIQRQARAERVYHRDTKIAIGLFLGTIIYLAGHALGAHLAGRL